MKRAIALILMGLALLTYPVLAQYFARKNQMQAARAYASGVEEMTGQRLDALWAEAEAKRDDPTAYEELLDPEGSGVMATLEIPKIRLTIPVYHGVSDTALRRGTGHLPETDLPLGGRGRKCVVTGHRGLPGAELFTRLDELEPGDRFTLRVLGRTLTYEVDEIKIVTPDQTEVLKVVPGEDRVTLLTCTPYGVNTHRLLVEGIRVETAETPTPEEPLPTLGRSNTWALLLGVAAGMLLLMIMGLIRHKRAGR